MPPDILVQDLYYAYPALRKGDAPAPVLNGVTFQAARGEFIVLLGRVGAGKTTLCMALNGLVPHATGGVFRGNVVVLGQNTRQRAVADLARSVGLVFQDPETQLVQMRVEDEVAFGPENLGVPPDEIERRVSWALEAVGLAGYRDRSPLLLSGGEKQRVAIAAMLAMRPQVLVLDEPTASLDPAGKAAVFDVLAELRHRHEITIFLATQELERIGRFADRVLVLHDGRIALDGSPTTVLRQVARLQEWGIGAPQIAELGYHLAKRTAGKYSFIGIGEAYKVLRRECPSFGARKVEAVGDTAPVSAVYPLDERNQVVVEGVTYAYPDGAVALRDVNLTLNTGDFVALAGPNGAGKTTLAKHLNGLLKPTRGRVLIARRDTRTTRVAELARQVGYAFQNPDHQIFAATVQEEIAFGLHNQGLPPAMVARRVAEVLDIFQLIPYADYPPALLSFGQRRKVALASIIAMQPQVLILDEPTGGLDWRSRQELMDVVVGFNRLGRTIVLITHDMRLVAEYASRVVVLLDGAVLFDGAPRTLFAHAEILKQTGLALPPVTRLARRLSAVGMAPDVLTTAEFIRAWQTRRIQPHAGPPEGGKEARKHGR